MKKVHYLIDLNDLFLIVTRFLPKGYYKDQTGFLYSQFDTAEIIK